MDIGLSIYNLVYKIVTTIIANRQEQFMSLYNRKIQDAVEIAQERFHSINVGKQDQQLSKFIYLKLTIN